MTTTAQASDLFKVLQAFLNFGGDRDLPITSALVFARIACAGADGIGQKELGKELKLQSSTLSRTVQTLSDLHYAKAKPGLGLIERHTHRVDIRKRSLRLSTKGLSLLARISV